MKNKKLILLSMVALLSLTVATGCGSSEKQATTPATSAAAKSAASMPNEDPGPIAKDLERKLKDTLTMVKEKKLAEAKVIMAEALRTHDRLTVHITDARVKENLKKSIIDVNEAVKASPADQKGTEAKIAAAFEAIKQANDQLEGHKH